MPSRSGPPGSLWIAVHLPALSLESFAATLSAGERARPIALVDEHRIAAVDAAGRALGVRPGLKRATALALAPSILLGSASPARDAAALQPVAHAALAFTPMVCLQPPRRPGEAADTVLLEVQASLRYFGGSARLLRRLEAALQPLGHATRIAAAATAAAAAILARVEPPPLCLDAEATRRALEAAPIWLVGPGREHWEAIQGMGLHRVADLLGLPRSGLARRFGEVLLDQIDAAFGRRPEPREAIVLPPVFESRLELFSRADSAEQVGHAAGVLLERLIAWLAAQHAFVRRFRLALHHEARWRRDDRTPAETPLEIALAEPSRDRAHLASLLRERLERLELPAPTLELSLRADDIVKRAPPSGELFPTQASHREGLVRLVERLQARLGEGSVQRLEPVEDHRPEKANVARPADVSKKPPPRRAPLVHWLAAARQRPVFLQRPEPLAERDTLPLWRGRPLVLLAGPERIEAGWWDGDLACRDYFIAQQDDGALVWIYRRRLPRPDEPGALWYVQGNFA